MKTSLRALVLLALVLPFATPAFAQFGQNKITYGKFKWNVYRSPHFDVHYYLEEEPQLEELVSEAESAYLDLSRRLDHEIKFRIPLMLYRTHAEFEQTNIQTEEIGEYVGAFAEPFQNRMVVPIDTPSDKRFTTIRHELTHIFEFDILFAGSLRRALRSNPPAWLMEGLASYLGDDEDSFDQMIIRDAVVNNEVPTLEQLRYPEFLTYRFGHAIFDFIETNYGAQGLRTFLFEFRKVLLTTSPEKAFQDAFGLSADAFDRRFARFLRQRYLPVLTEKRAPEDYGREVGKPERRGQRERVALSPAISPSGELIAALAVPKLKLDVVILSAKDGKLIRNLTKGFTNKYERLSFDIFSRNLAWSPDGDRLAFFVKKESWRELLVYEVLTGRLDTKIAFKDIADCASPAFAPDGRSVAFSGNRDGVWDIFRYDFGTKAIDNLTQDEYYDTDPTWSADGKTLLYNRRIGSFPKIFSVEVGAPERKVQLTAGAASDISPAYSRDGKSIYFSSDRGEYGVFNIHRLDLATGRIERLTDLTTGAFTPSEMTPAEDGTKQIAIGSFFGSQFRVFKMKTAGTEVDRAIKVGEKEPQTSPLAPSRRAAFRAANQARAKADAPPPVFGTTKPARPDQPPPLPAPAAPANAGGASDAPPAPVAPPPPPDRPDADLAPFKAPLQLGLDPSRKSPYKVRFALDMPQIGAGIANDGTILTNVMLNFTDLLGNQRIAVAAYSVSSFSNIDVTYLNLTRRFDWGARLFDYRDYYVVSDFSSSQRVQRATRLTQLSAFAWYPFNRYYRIEGTLGYGQRRLDYPTLADPGNPFSPVVFQSYSDDYPFAGLALVGDTTRYQAWGPYQGYRFRIDVEELHFTAGDSKGDNITTLSVDLRKYMRVTARSLVALRVAGIKQSGERGAVYPLGGLNQLRGYDFREFFGTNILYANVEYRFPLIDFLQWGFGLPMGPFRGFLFADYGTAWFDDANHLVCDDYVNFTNCSVARGKAAYDDSLGTLRAYSTKDADGRWRDIHGSIGMGFNVPIFGLPCTWAFAKKYDGKDFSGYSSSFYIYWDW